VLGGEVGCGVGDDPGFGQADLPAAQRRGGVGQPGQQLHCQAESVHRRAAGDPQRHPDLGGGDLRGVDEAGGVGRGGDSGGCAAVHLGDQRQLLGVQHRDLPLGFAQPIHDRAIRHPRVLEHVFDTTDRPVLSTPRAHICGQHLTVVPVGDPLGGTCTLTGRTACPGADTDGMPARRESAKSRLVYLAVAVVVIGGLVAFGLMSLFELTVGVAVGWTVVLAVALLLLLAVLVG